MSRYQPSPSTHAQGRGGKSKGEGEASAKAHHPPTSLSTRSKPLLHSSTKPIGSPSTVMLTRHQHEPLLNTHDLSPGDSSSAADAASSDEEDPDRTRVNIGGGMGSKGKQREDAGGGMEVDDFKGMGGGDEDDEEEEEEDGEDGEDSDDEEGGWNADEVTLVLPPSNDEDSMEEEEGESEDEDEERTTAEINEMLQELGTKEYARLRKDLQEGVQPIYNSLQTLHSQANKHAKTLATHKTGEMLAVQQFFESLGTQGRDAFSFTKDYGEQKAALLLRWEDAHARKEERKLKFLEDVAKLRRINQTKHEELLTEAGDAYASFTNKANHIGSEKEYNKEVNRTMKRGLPVGK